MKANVCENPIHFKMIGVKSPVPQEEKRLLGFLKVGRFLLL